AYLPCVLLQGRISFYMTAFGEEGTLFGSAAAIKPRDMVFAQYREAGVLMYRGFTLDQFADQLFSNEGDLGKGRQMPVHYGSKELNYQTVSSPLATQLPQAAGAAYGFKVAKEDRIAICYFGEGAASEGDFHAALNFAATRDCPVLYFARNNGYAISTPVKDQFRGDGIASRGAGYGIPVIRVDGNDLFAVYEVTKKAREMILTGGRPVLIEAMSYRQGHHSTSDDSTRYREVSEIKFWKDTNCPINRLKLYMLDQGWWSEERDQALKDAERINVLQSLAKAEAKGIPEIQTMFDDVYFEKPRHIQAAKLPFPKKSLFAPPNATRRDLLNKFVTQLTTITLSSETSTQLDALLDVRTNVKDTVKPTQPPAAHEPEPALVEVEAPVAAALPVEPSEASSVLVTESPVEATPAATASVEVPVVGVPAVDTVVSKVHAEAPAVQTPAAVEPAVTKTATVHEPQVIASQEVGIVAEQVAEEPTAVEPEEIAVGIVAAPSPAVVNEAPVVDVIQVATVEEPKVVAIPAVAVVAEQVLAEEAPVSDASPVVDILAPHVEKTDVAGVVDVSAVPRVDVLEAGDFPVGQDDTIHVPEVTVPVVQAPTLKDEVVVDHAAVVDALADVEEVTDSDKVVPEAGATKAVTRQDASTVQTTVPPLGSIAVVPVNVFPTPVTVPTTPASSVEQPPADVTSPSVDRERPNLLSIDDDDVVYASSSDGKSRSVDGSSGSVEFSTTDDERYSTSPLTDEQRKRRNKKRALKRRSRKSAADAKLAQVATTDSP
ncbi:hypothetical protein DYB37_003963, partial [Aphanomyces astaci]